MLNKDGSLQRTARFRGLDLASATPAELVATAGRLNNALRRLGSGWAAFVEAQRVPAHAYPMSQFPDPVSALLDAERHAQFEGEPDQETLRGSVSPANGAHFESPYFLTLVWMPPADEASRAGQWLYEGAAETGIDPREHVASFVSRTDRLLDLFDGFMPEAAWLSDAEALAYLHSTISARRQRVRVPETPMHLDALLADTAPIGGLAPRLGDAYVKTLSIVGFQTATWPGLLDELNGQAFEYRWATAPSASTRPTPRRSSRRSAGNGSPTGSRSRRSSSR